MKVAFFGPPLAVVLSLILLTACENPREANNGRSVSSSPSASGATVVLTITSDPAGALVVVDGHPKGETPTQVSIPAGEEVSYTVTADEPHEEFDLYEPYSGQATLHEDTAIDVWITRTTAEEQEAAIERFEAQRARAATQRIESAVRSSDWTYRQRVDSITDEDRSYVVTDATTYPRHYSDSYLMIRCDDSDPTSSDGIAMLIQSDTYISNDDTSIDWRFDDDPPVTRQLWRNSTDGTAVFNLSYKTMFLREMVDASNLAVRIYDYKGTSHDYTFSVDHAREAVQMLGCYRGAAIQ